MVSWSSQTRAWKITKLLRPCQALTSSRKVLICILHLGTGDHMQVLRPLEANAMDRLAWECTAGMSIML